MSTILSVLLDMVSLLATEKYHCVTTLMAALGLHSALPTQSVRQSDSQPMSHILTRIYVYVCVSMYVCHRKMGLC